ncbi:unnamed protein product [Strongylus vulgaris]|uniref:Uncharacterized protein n=1 Tax=Strongylus vulgaris TaxID=40348 RepID=A0A3P7K0K1_STRVU|nr:unnamed protein product [Strongylus vulgaris]
MWRSTILLLLTLAACMFYPAQSTGGLDIEKLGAGGKKFFIDIKKDMEQHMPTTTKIFNNAGLFSKLCIRKGR